MGYFVYIMTTKTKSVLYTGMTNNLKRRAREHREGKYKGFTWHYNVDRLVYYEVTDSAASARMREKQIKAGSRKRKVDLINQFNPEWNDLYEMI